MSRAQLVETYISALNLTEVAVVGAGKQARIVTGEPPDGEVIQLRLYFKPSHAELVLAAIGRDGGLSNKPAALLVASIKQAAATLGAPFRTPGQLHDAAETHVAAIVARVKAAGLSGGLKHWNGRYRQYRRAQVEKGEPAIPYSAFIEQAVMLPTVRTIAARAR